MYICIYVCMYVCVCRDLWLEMAYLSESNLICLSVCLSIYLSISLSISLSLYLSIYSKTLYWHKKYTFALPKQVNNKVNSIIK